MATLSGTQTSTEFGSSATETTSGGFDWGSISGEILLKFLYVLEAAAIMVAAIFLSRWVRRKFEKMENCCIGSV